MLGDVSAAVTGLQAAIEIIKATKGLANRNELVATLSEVNAKLVAAQESAIAANERHSALMERTSALEAELRALKNAKAERENYVLATLPSGTPAYRLKEAVEPAQLAMYACVPCMSEGKVAPLHPLPAIKGRCVCRTCNRQYQYEEIKREPAKFPRRRKE